MRLPFLAIKTVTVIVVFCGSSIVMAQDVPPTVRAPDQNARVPRPFWRSSIMMDEPILFIKKGDRSEASGALLFAPTKIVSVHDASGKIIFEEGSDYRWTPGCREIVLPVGSRIVSKTTQDLRRPAGSQQLAIVRRGGTDEILLAEGKYHDMQTMVTYAHDSDTWKGPVPEFAGNRLPQTLKKLESKKPLTIALLGDSISTGCNASGFLKISPFQPAYYDLLTRNLKSAYGDEITLHNFSVGGKAADWGRQTIDKVIKVNPDLIIIAFGMNDACGRPEKAYRTDMVGTIATIRKMLPQTEIILVATSLGNPEWAALHPELFWRYRQTLNSLCRPGVAMADMTSMWAALLKHKSYYDLTGNGVNHPNDFGHRIYADVLSTLLIPADTSSAN